MVRIRRGSRLLVCLLSLTIVACTSEISPEEPAIRACFDQYKQAILNQDGTAAVAFVDTNTRDYYGRMRDLALKGDRNTVRNLSIADKLMVLTIRHRIPLDSVSQMTGETLFVYAVDNGWIGKDSVARNEVGRIAVSGPNATGVHISAGNRSELKWQFHKENDCWRLDLASVASVIDAVLKQLARENGLTEDEFLISLLEVVSGKEVDATVWDPMIR